jgi:hypothetical protein
MENTDSTENGEKSKKPDESPISGKEKSRLNLNPPFTSENQPEHIPGRPKGAVSLVALMRKLAAAEAKGLADARDKIREMYGEEIAEKITNAHIYIARVHQAAIKGEEWAIKIWLNYLDGMPRQSIELGGQKDNPLETKFNFDGIDPEKLRQARDTLEQAKQKNDSDGNSPA